MPSLGHRIGAALARALSPLAWPFSWWFRLRLRQATCYVVPDVLAAAVVVVAVSLFLPHLLFRHPMHGVAALLATPLALTSVLRLRDGRVTRVRLAFGIPYGLTRVPAGSRFTLYEAWEDDRPSGVAFSLPPALGEYLHLGLSANARDLYASIGSELRAQGWCDDPKDIGALRGPFEGAPVPCTDTRELECDLNLKHLHLHARNRAASEAFYARWLGLSVVRSGESLTFMTDGQDFDLALMDDPDPQPMPAWFHFGAKLASADEVQSTYERMSTAGLRMRRPLYRDDDLASFRVEDPDGYAIEIYWERPGASLD